MAATLNVFDLVFLSFTLIFVIGAALRGFVKEIFSLCAWAIAFTLSYLLTPYAVDLIGKNFESKMFLDIAARSVLFIVILLIFNISTANLCKNLQEKMPGSFDKSLGVLYGFGKTLLIFGFVYAITANVYGTIYGSKKGDKIPSWMRDAKCHSILEASGETMVPMVEKIIEGVTVNFEKSKPEADDLDKKIDTLLDEKKAEKNDSTKQKDKAKNAAASEDEKALEEMIEKQGYTKKEIEKMNRLIEILGKEKSN